MPGHRQIVAVLCWLALVAATARGAIVLNATELWASSGALASWTNNAPNGVGTGLATVSNPGSGGADGDGYLRLTFSLLPFPSAEDDTLYSSASAYTGNYQINDLGVQFSFSAKDVMPLPNPVFYLHSAVSGNLWQYALTGMSVGSWTVYTIPFDITAGWTGSGGAAAFWADLANIDWIGINIARDSFDSAQQVFGIDSWKYLVVPEPGSIWILSVSLVSIAATLRRKNSMTGSRNQECNS